MEQNEMLNSSESTRVHSAMKNMLACVPYGSRLYGTSTPTSDYDYKMLYLPKFEDVLLGRQFTNFKARFNEDGSVLSDDAAQMSDNGYEMEFVALQTFMRDWLVGQTYAVEMAYALLQGFGEHDDPVVLAETVSLVHNMVEHYQSHNVAGMVGFAMKQTFDYVHRGQRLKEVTLFRDTLQSVLGNVTLVKERERLDSMFGDKRVLDFAYEVGVAAFPGRFEKKVVVNGRREEDAVVFAGRTYVESTPLSEMMSNLNRMVKQYGARSTSAAENTVDTKSLMHAVRVYQQVLELLQTGKVTFPRPNRDELLGVRNLTTPLEEVVERLRQLDAEVQEVVKEHPSKVQELTADFEAFTVLSLLNRYM